MNRLWGATLVAFFAAGCQILAGIDEKQYGVGAGGVASSVSAASASSSSTGGRASTGDSNSSSSSSSGSSPSTSAASSASSVTSSSSTSASSASGVTGIPRTCGEAQGTIGCCIGNVRYSCDAGQVVTVDCPTGTVCSWSPGMGVGCVDGSTATADPSGTFPTFCEGVPRCNTGTDCESGYCFDGVCNPWAAVLSLGNYHTCAATTAGRAKCWGSVISGEIGDPSATNTAAPVDVIGLTGTVWRVTVGNFFSCAASGDAFSPTCWGYGGRGDLGDGQSSDASTPQAVLGLTTGYGIAASDDGDHACALDESGLLWCWGDNNNGCLGNGTNVDHEVAPVMVTGSGFTASLAAGQNHSCDIIETGAVMCWGFNGFGQLGNGTTTPSNTPVTATGLSGATQISAGDNHTCALDASGGVWCWGKNDAGQLGVGDTMNRSAPTPVPGLASGVTAIAAGGAHSCAVTASTGLVCWGDNAAGDLGDGSGMAQSSPVAVTGLTSGVALVYAGGQSTCAITARGTFCWGDNTWGELGTGSTGASPAPAPVIQN